VKLFAEVVCEPEQLNHTLKLVRLPVPPLPRGERRCSESRQHLPAAGILGAAQNIQYMRQISQGQPTQRGRMDAQNLRENEPGRREKTAVSSAVDLIIESDARLA